MLTTGLEVGIPAERQDREKRVGDSTADVPVVPADRGKPDGPPTLSSARSHLKETLVGVDALSIALGSVLGSLATYPVSGHSILWRIVLAVSAAAVGVWAMRHQELYLSRVSTVRTAEINGTIKAMAVLAAVQLFVDRILQVGLHLREVIAGALLGAALVTLGRSVFRTWLAIARRGGRYQRGMLIVGADSEAKRLIELFDCHRELGVQVVGCLGRQSSAMSAGLARYWLGPIEAVVDQAKSTGASGVIVTSSVLNSPALNGLIRNLQEEQLHVHVATGILGVHSRRVRTLPLAHEPMLYLEPATLSRSQFVVKRVFDIVVSLLALIVLSPVLFVVAVAIKLSDKGPVLFKQNRVGHNGVLFPVYKFRTMVVDAEARFEALRDQNQRSGPLFKLARDPRITRVGGFLRTSSLDELPQLINVLKGEMSLVGPRPALPSEVDEFPEALRARERVLPGITGLWQVEARDNPSFEAYHRLDLFYVENWSVTLDLIIILGTIEQLVAKIVFRGREMHDEPARLDPVQSQSA
jgi:exopolysaccharide biosynthesis polyprenyl glycosylphosphotransferase